MRRVLRVFPLYYGVLVLILILLPLSGVTGRPTIHASPWWLWLYGTNIPVSVQNQWVFDADWVRLGHFWSLAVEEHFYLVWPLVVLTVSPRRLVWVCAGCVAVSALLRLGVAARGGGHELAAYAFTLLRLDGLAVGSALAVLVREKTAERWSRRNISLATSLCLAALIAIIAWRGGFNAEDRWVTATALLPLDLLFGVVVLLAATARQASLTEVLLANPVLRFFGKYSYALYVFHLPLLPLLEHWAPLERLQQLAGGSYLLAALAYACIGTAASVALALLSWNLLEKRVLTLKRFFEHEPRPRVEPAQPLAEASLAMTGGR
jgi:peptidoglycan/LPS O-acetylase OafA/YrhL